MYGVIPLQQALATDIANGVFGNFTALILGFVANPWIYDYACDLSPDGCIVIHNLPPAPDEAICEPDQFTGQVPLDCTSRGRKVGTRRFDSYLNTFSSSSGYLDPWLGLLETLEPQTRVAFITSSLQFDQVIRTEAVDTISDLNLELVFDYTLLVNYSATTGVYTTVNYTQAQAEAIVQQMINADVTAYAFIGQYLYETQTVSDPCTKILQAMKTLNWVPAAMNLLTATELLQDPSIVGYAYSSLPWDSRVKGTDFRTVNNTLNLELFPAVNGLDSSQVFTNVWNAAYPAYTDVASVVSAAAGMAGIVTLQKLIETSGSINPKDLINTAKFLSVPSHWGLIQFDAFGRRVLVDKDVIVIQLTSTTSTFPSNAVLPQGIGSAAIYPAPSFNSRNSIADEGLVLNIAAVTDGVIWPSPIFPNVSVAIEYGGFISSLVFGSFNGWELWLNKINAVGGIVFKVKEFDSIDHTIYIHYS